MLEYLKCKHIKNLRKLMRYVLKYQKERGLEWYKLGRLQK